MNANTELEALFKNHNFSATKRDDLLILNLEKEVTIESRLNQREHEKGCTSQLDVSVKLPNGQAIVESFGDLGENKQDAKIKNIQNFALNSFHPITACLTNNKEDKQVTIETWTINHFNWYTFIGNFCMKGLSSESVSIPKELFPSIEHLLRRHIHDGQDYFWGRFFLGQFHQKVSNIEFLVNNENHKAGQSVLSNLPWELMDDFYSIRMFVILKKSQNQKNNGKKWWQF